MNSCTFIGHSDCIDFMPELYKTIENHILCNDVDTFYVGHNGNFDRLVYKTLIDLSFKYDFKIYVVLAYLGKLKDNYYDPLLTIFPSILEKVPPKYAILKRNEYMLEKSQFLISYVNNSFTNSYSVLKKALNKNLTVTNLGNLILN